MPPEVTDDPATTPARRPRRAPAAPSCLLEDDAPDHPGVRRLYTAAMMGDVLGVPPAAVRHWIRSGLLEVARSAGSLEWFDFGQLVVGRHLARLLSGGLSLRDIDARLAALAPGGGRAAARAVERVVVDGRRLSIESDGQLLGPGGQLQFTFYTERLAEPADEAPTIVTLADRSGVRRESAVAEIPIRTGEVAEILDLADDLEAAGEYVEAAEALRAVLQAEGPSARVMFMLAELLYRAGDLTAARERYYAVIEIDPDHLRARASLGCVLAELGEHELALAALEGVLRQEPSYADAHWHIAGVLAETGRPAEARHHLRRFLDLAPQSPWADLARDRLAHGAST